MSDPHSSFAEPRPSPDNETLTWAETRNLIRSDFERLVESCGGGSFTRRAFWFFLPNFQALFFYRLYRYLFVKGWRNTARLLSLYSLYHTGVEIPPTSSIGPSCLIGHAVGVVLCGKIGARFCVFGQGGTGGGMGEEDIGGGAGFPVVGDDVVFGFGAKAFGPIRIGNRVKLGPTAFINRDVPDDSLVVVLPSKVVKPKTSSHDTPAANCENDPVRQRAAVETACA
jgi:serine O-acetyltransferase